MKRRLMFVDDEQDVIRGLKRLLRPMRHEYDMEFLSDPNGVLERLDVEQFDVVVSDMRMPGIDGAALLAQVRDKHPMVARFVLSGQADRETVMRCVEATHQYLSKPCDPDLLKATVTRACTLRDLLSSSELSGIVANVRSLPSLPSVYTEVVKELRSPEPSLVRVGELIEQDIAMSVKILKLVNSSFFGMRRQIQTPGQAVNLLGGDVVKALVLTLGVFSQFDNHVVPGFSLQGVMHHSLEVANLAKSIALSQSDDKHLHNEAYLAGLLHDVGKLILIDQFEKPFKEVVRKSRDEHLRLDLVEREAFGVTHAELGAYLLGLWGLSDNIVEAVAYHHRPADCPASQFTALAAIHIANGLCTDRLEDISESCGLDSNYIESLGLTSQLDEFRSWVPTETAEVPA